MCHGEGVKARRWHLALLVASRGPSQKKPAGENPLQKRPPVKFPPRRGLPVLLPGAGRTREAEPGLGVQWVLPPLVPLGPQGCTPPGKLQSAAPRGWQHPMSGPSCPVLAAVGVCSRHELKPASGNAGILRCRLVGAHHDH